MQKTALITGATKGIGKAILGRLVDAGYVVYANYGHDDAAMQACRESLCNQKQVLFLKEDLSTCTGAERLVERMPQSLDVLILNAACTNRKSIAEISIEEWNTVLNTNLTVPFYITKLLFNRIRENGSVLFVSSVMGGKLPHPVSTCYGVSKAGINMLCQLLVKDFAPRSITVNAVMPAFVNTEWQDSKPAEWRNRIESRIALKRFAEPEEIAELCIHCISNRYINGSLLTIDGGYDYM